jgi:hypothetical protein
MLRLSNYFLGLCAIALSVNLFVACQKDQSGELAPINKDVATLEDRGPCIISFTSTQPLDVCGTQSNAFTCTNGGGITVPGYETGVTNNIYSVGFGTYMEFTNNTPNTATVVINGVTRTLMPGGMTCATVGVKKCFVTIGACI